MLTLLVGGRHHERLGRDVQAEYRYRQAQAGGQDSRAGASARAWPGAISSTVEMLPLNTAPAPAPTSAASQQQRQARAPAVAAGASAQGRDRLSRPAGAAAGWLLAQEPVPGGDELAGLRRAP